MHTVQTDSAVALKRPLQWVLKLYFPDNKAALARSWPLCAIWLWDSEWVTCFYSPYMPLWSGGGSYKPLPYYSSTFDHPYKRTANYNVYDHVIFSSILSHVQILSLVPFCEVASMFLVFRKPLIKVFFWNIGHIMSEGCVVPLCNCLFYPEDEGSSVLQNFHKCLTQ